MWRKEARNFLSIDALPVGSFGSTPTSGNSLSSWVELPGLKPANTLVPSRTEPLVTLLRLKLPSSSRGSPS